MKPTKPVKTSVVILQSGEERRYGMGPIESVFKADGKETAGRYSVSEWWLEPHTSGPGLHSHEEDDLFYVIEGTMSIHADGQWHDLSRGAFVLVPAGIQHDFENRSDKRAGILNFSIPGNFEAQMPSIVEWFRDNPPGRTGR